MGLMLGQLDYRVLLNAALTTTTNGTAVDLAGLVNVGDGQCTAFLAGTVRTYTGTPSVTVTIEEDSTSGFTAPTTVSTFVAIATTAANDATIAATFTKRYARGVATFSAVTTTGSYALILVGGKRTV